MSKLYLISTLFLIISCASVGARNPASKKQFVIHSHSGSATYPDNMMTAFQHAVTQGADVIEMDLQITKDDKVVVAQDAHLKEECSHRQGTAIGNKTVFFRDLKLSEVDDLDCGSRTAGNVIPVPGEGISSLEHILESFRRVNAKSGKPIGFNIEIKYNPSQPHLYPLRAFYAKHVLAVIAESGIDNSRLMIQSFDISILEEIRKLHPTIRLSPLIGDDYAMNRAPSYVNDLKTNVITPHHTFVNKKMVENFHKMGVEVIPWAVNDEKTKKQMRDAGVDGVITDAIDLFTPQ